MRYAGPIRGLDHGVILDHGDYLTVIAKLGELTLPIGTHVARGDRLGRAAHHRVYLEVRAKIGPGGLPIDPEPLLKRRAVAPKAARRVSSARMSRASTPPRSSPEPSSRRATLAVAVPKDVTRFRTFDAFAQSLSLIEANYVDPVDEQALLRDAQRGMLHNLDVHSTYLPPNRYQKMRQDTEGEFGGIGVVLAPGFIDDARPSVPPYPIVDEIVRELAGRGRRRPARRSRRLDRRRADRRGRQGAQGSRRVGGEAARRVRHARRDRGAARRLERSAHVHARARAGQAGDRARASVLEPRIGYLADHAVRRGDRRTTSPPRSRDCSKQNALGALVLDLRDDPGGLVDQAVLVADQFLDDGTIVTIRGRKGSVETQTAHKGGAGVGVPIIALVDRRHRVGGGDPRGGAARSRSREARRPTDLRQRHRADVLRSRRRLRASS